MSNDTFFKEEILLAVYTALFRIKTQCTTKITTLQYLKTCHVTKTRDFGSEVTLRNPRKFGNV